MIIRALVIFIRYKVDYKNVPVKSPMLKKRNVTFGATDVSTQDTPSRIEATMANVLGPNFFRSRTVYKPEKVQNLISIHTIR